MIEKRKIIQLTLISIGLVLILFTYFIYPTINKNKLFEAKTGKEKINLQEKIKKLAVKPFFSGSAKAKPNITAE